ncbi:helix-turn-helix domain-containing protein [Actinocorallia aurea]
MSADVLEMSASGSFHTTESLPVARRRAYWREALSRTFGAVHMTVSDEVYSGTIRTAQLGRVQAVTVDGDCLSALRTHRLVAQGNEEDFVVVKLLDRGVGRIEQDGREAFLEPGGVFVYDMARPVRLDLPQAFRTKSIVMPRGILGLKESDVAEVTAFPLSTGTPVGRLLCPLLAGLVDGAGTFPPHASELLVRNVVDLLSVFADEALRRSTTDASAGNRILLLRIQTFIDHHLADPDLTPQVIAQAHHISLRYLHKIFESEDVTVGRWIQQRRLEECRRDLRRRRNNSTIAAVAHRWGFVSATHFSRAFRIAYGMTPREWRERHSWAL